MQNTTYRAGLYLRLSKDDDLDGESLSIGTQRSILTDYCAANQYEVYKVYVDDGYSGPPRVPGADGGCRKWRNQYGHHQGPFPPG